MAGSVIYNRGTGEYEPVNSLEQRADIEAEEARMKPEVLDPSGYSGPARMTPTHNPYEAIGHYILPADPVDPDEDVKNPKHYSQYVIEPIDFIVKNDIPYREGNVIKYVCRWKSKDGVRDLKKARQYLDLMIRDLEGGE